MGKLLAALAIVAVLLTGGDVAARRWTESRMATYIENNVPSSHAKVRVSSFPFLGRLALGGSVRKITAHVDHLVGPGLTLDFVDIEVDGVKVDRTALLQDRKVRLQHIDSGVVRAEISEASLSTALGVPVKLGNGTAQVIQQGVPVTAKVAVVDNRLVVSGPVSVAASVPKLPVLPCAASVTVRPGRLQVACVVHEIPPALLTT